MNVCRTDVLFQPAQVACAENGDDGRVLVHHPRQRDLRGGGMAFEQGEQLLILPKNLPAILRHRGATVGPYFSFYNVQQLNY